MGRAARNVRGRVILYADKITGSIERAVTEIKRRRQVQKDYNQAHGIVPTTIQKPVRARLVEKEPVEGGQRKGKEWQTMPPEVLQNKIWEWKREMRKAAEVLDFEKAAKLRDIIREAEASL